jgi:MFS family permease
MLKKRWFFFTMLFLIVILHAFVFGSVQDVLWLFSGVLGIQIENIQSWLTMPLYITAVLTALNTQRLCRKMGIKKVLLSGLAANLIAFAFFYLFYVVFPLSGPLAYLFLILGMAAAGFAITSVATVMSTYVIVAFSKVIALGLVILYSGLNLGISVSNPLFSVFSKANLQLVYMGLLAVLVILAIGFVHSRFTQPEIPSYLNERRYMGRLWSRLRGRLVLFMIAMVLYGLIEYTFNLFGYSFVAQKLSSVAADKALIVFWLALNIGQIFIGVPAFWIRPSRVVAVLPLFMILALILLPFQSQEGALLLNIIIGGLGCSAVFPLLLAMLALEVIGPSHSQAKEENIPELESCSGYIIASYHFGTGLIVLQKSLLGNQTIAGIDFHFNLAIAYAVILGLILFYFNRTAAQKVE